MVVGGGCMVTRGVCMVAGGEGMRGLLGKHVWL